ncbi:MAG TPA: glucose-1-phosphate adenylyltransferase [Saprospiraceae bacterium]|nr:glucose-1-phosphate adenylyltransferase [Saprospiraceae bacterium]
MNKSLSNRVISLILGGGVGSRLYPLTKDRSKPAVPIGGKYRLIDIPISNCLNVGFTRIFVLTQFNSASLNRHIKNTYHFDTFSHGFVDILAAEQTRHSMDWFQGTADAVRQSVRNIVHEDFEFVMILSGDQLYQMDLEQMTKYHLAQNAEVTIATIPVMAERATSFGIMKVNGAGFIESFIEKPAYDLLPHWQSPVDQKLKEQGRSYLASMGIYLFNRKVLGRLLEENPNAVDFGKELIPYALKNGFRVASYLYDGYWTDIGDIKSFFEANIELTDQVPAFNLFDNERKIFTRPRLLPPTKIFGTTINESIVAEGAILHAKEVSKSVIGIRARIGNNTVIKHSYIMGNDTYQTIQEMQGSRIRVGIGDECYIENAIIDKHARIGNGSVIIGDASLQDIETDHYSIKEGIVVINKNAVIEPGSVIGVSK